MITANQRGPESKGGAKKMATSGCCCHISNATRSTAGSSGLPVPERLADWQQYLQGREELFSRSRTISVNEMATTLAHELNQPLGTVANILNGLRGRLLATAGLETDLLDALAMAEQQTEFAARIISRIREFTAARQPVFREINVATLISESVHLLDWVFAAEQVDVSQLITRQSLLFEGDYTLLQQVVTNLLRNAVEATRKNRYQIGPRSQATVVVKSYLGKTGIKIEVIDNGPGLSDIDREKMFTTFHTTKANGMGVGLNICRSFVELHHGKLWLTQNSDCGCTAHVLLPCMAKKEMDSEKENNIHHR